MILLFPLKTESNMLYMVWIISVSTPVIAVLLHMGGQKEAEKFESKL